MRRIILMAALVAALAAALGPTTAGAGTGCQVTARSQPLGATPITHWVDLGGNGNHWTLAGVIDCGGTSAGTMHLGLQKLMSGTWGDPAGDSTCATSSTGAGIGPVAKACNLPDVGNGGTGCSVTGTYRVNAWVSNGTDTDVSGTWQGCPAG